MPRRRRRSWRFKREREREREGERERKRLLGTILCNDESKDKVMHELENSSIVSWLGSIGVKHVRMIDRTWWASGHGGYPFPARHWTVQDKEVYCRWKGLF